MSDTLIEAADRFERAAADLAAAYRDFAGEAERIRLAAYAASGKLRGEEAATTIGPTRVCQDAVGTLVAYGLRAMFREARMQMPVGIAEAPNLAARWLHLAQPFSPARVA